MGKSSERNYGVDINFLDDRLKTTFEYYKERRNDILLRDGTAPGMLGFITLFKFRKCRQLGLGTFL